jgi:hypothetical protein
MKVVSNIQYIFLVLFNLYVVVSIVPADHIREVYGMDQRYLDL